LRKNNELLKKRVYSKNEFENQYKTAKSESQEFGEKLKVSEKIRKQQKNLIRQLQAQLNRMRVDKKSPPAISEKKPTTIAEKKTKPTLKKKMKTKKVRAESDENTNMNMIKGEHKQGGMMPKYTTFGEIDVKVRKGVKKPIR